MKYLKPTAFLAILFLFTCGNTVDTKVKLTQAKKDQLSENSCLDQYMDAPCTLLSIDEVITITGFEPSKLKISDPTEAKVARRLECIYMWDSGRTEKIETAYYKGESELKDRVSIGHIRTYDPSKTSISTSAWFDSSFPITSAEELASREAKYKEKLAAGEKNRVEEMTIKTLKSIDRNRVEGLGDRAIADILVNQSSATLGVLHKNTIFQLSVDVSKDSTKNLELAMELARLVLSKCN